MVIVVIGVFVVAWLYRERWISPGVTYRAYDKSLDKLVVDGIVAADRDGVVQQGVKAVIVPHHAVATKSIALGIKSFQASHPDIIVVISPDHYGRCEEMICTTKGKYMTFFGDVSIDERRVAVLTKSDLVAESDLFKDEHGVYTIIPYLKHYLPDVKVVPIVISQKSKGGDKERGQIVELLGGLLKDKGVGLVVSSDFSHYLPLVEAKQKDAKTQASFCSGNSREILNLENPSQSDCPLCLWILRQEAQKFGFWNPVVLAHTNSAELLGDILVRETTSHFTFTFSHYATPGQSCSFVSKR